MHTQYIPMHKSIFQGSCATTARLFSSVAASDKNVGARQVHKTRKPGGEKERARAVVREISGLQSPLRLITPFCIARSYETAAAFFDCKNGRKFLSRDSVGENS